MLHAEADIAVPLPHFSVTKPRLRALNSSTTKDTKLHEGLNLQGSFV